MTTVAFSCGAPGLLHEATAGDRWQQIQNALSGSTLAHEPEWCSIIRAAYGHDPLYLSVQDDAGHGGLLPAFVVRRPLAGTIVTSMPFLDSGGPCASSAAHTELLLKYLLAEAARLEAEAVDLRCTERLNVDVEPMQHKVNMVLTLTDRCEELWGKLDAAVRNQVRKAERSGLVVENGGLRQLGEFYSIYARRMRDLGSPAHALDFFREILISFGDRARVVLVRKDGEAIGGLVALSCKDTMVVPWASCVKEHFSLCPNMLLYWHTIRLACSAGFRRFDFGRSTRDSGTYRFKRQWGAREVPLFWYTLPVASRRPVTLPTIDGANLLCGIWQRLPLAVTRQIGPHVRRYLIQ
jgi:FemAB-related protein (PEP-CTERM system-associated)